MPSPNFRFNLTFACPRCQQTSRASLGSDALTVPCPDCHAQLKIPDGAFADGAFADGAFADGEGVGQRRLTRCLVCPGADLFVRKDFPQRLGVAVVVIGFVASTVAYYFHWIYATYALLLATALVDVLLYQFVGHALVCYRCGAHYRDLPGLDAYAPFNLETHERYRQQAARWAETSKT